MSEEFALSDRKNYGRGTTQTFKVLRTITAFALFGLLLIWLGHRPGTTSNNAANLFMFGGLSTALAAWGLGRLLTQIAVGAPQLTLTDDELIVRDVFKVRHISWKDLKPFMLSPTLSVSIISQPGKKTIDFALIKYRQTRIVRATQCLSRPCQWLE